MSYLIYKHGAFWFQIHVPNALVPRCGKFIRQNLQTSERSVAQPIVLQLAGQSLSRFSTAKMDADISTIYDTRIWLSIVAGTLV